MNYISLIYLIVFLPLCLLVYKIMPQKLRWAVLLIASYLFFFSISRKLIVYIFISTISIHYIGIWLSSCKKNYMSKSAEEKRESKKAYTRKRRLILLFGILINVGLLLFLKYFNFFGSNANHFLNMLSVPISVPVLKLGLPIGISFYTLQAVSYIVDVYQGKIEADENIGRLALFLSFFPIIMEGPICRYSDTAQALYAGAPLQYKNVTFGAQMILWGLFKNLIIADRLNAVVKTIFDHYSEYGGIVIIFGAICYTVQLYMNFSGTIDMTIGTGEMFGVKIPQNFRQPFFARTVAEFWQRWHITLGTWLKDYIFYPILLTKFCKNLGKKTKEKFSMYVSQLVTSSIALFAVWMCNGLWHGARWSYIFFGVYYLVLILLGKMTEPLVEKLTAKLHISKENIGYRIVQTVKMLVIIFTGEMFFRANGLSAGLSMFRSIFTGFSWGAFADGSLLKLGISGIDLLVVVAGLLVVLVVSILHEKGISIREKVAGLNIGLRWGIYYGAILTVIIFGAYGNGYIPAELIYAGF